MIKWNKIAIQSDFKLHANQTPVCENKLQKQDIYCWKRSKLLNCVIQV